MMTNILKRIIIDYCVAFTYILLASTIVSYIEHNFLSLMIIFLAGWLCHATQLYLKPVKEINDD